MTVELSSRARQGEMCEILYKEGQVGYAKEIVQFSKVRQPHPASYVLYRQSIGAYRVHRARRLYGIGWDSQSGPGRQAGVIQDVTCHRE